MGYAGSRHFDAHAYRTEDYEGVKDFARGCMRTYLILKEKAAQFNADPEIQALLARSTPTTAAWRRSRGIYRRRRPRAQGRLFDRVALGARGLGYERLDQLTIELLLVRAAKTRRPAVHQDSNVGQSDLDKSRSPLIGSSGLHNEGCEMANSSLDLTFSTTAPRRC